MFLVRSDHCQSRQVGTRVVFDPLGSFPLNFSGCGVIRWVFGGVDSTLFTAFLLIQNNQTDRAVSRTSQG